MSERPLAALGEARRREPETVALQVDENGAPVTLEAGSWFVCFVPGLTRQGWHRFVHPRHTLVFAMRPAGPDEWTLFEAWWQRLLTATITAEQARKFLLWGARGDVLLVREAIPGRGSQIRGWMTCATLCSFLLGRAYWVWTPHGLYKRLLREPNVCRVDVSVLLTIDTAQLTGGSRVVAACSKCASGEPARQPGAPKPPARLRAALGPEAWDRLRAGEVVVEVVRKEESEGGARGRVRAAIAIDAPPERVWPVLTDFESWPEFLPDVTSVAVERQDDRRVMLRQEASVLWTTVAYTTLRRLEPARGRITWRLDPARPHDIESVSGSCQLVPLEERRVTVMEYRSRMDVGRALPDFVQEGLVERSLPKELRAVRAEVEHRRGR